MSSDKLTFLKICFIITLHNIVVTLMTTGERIKQRREELGLTQTELAERMGYKSRAAICTVEKGKEDLTTTRIRKFAEALQTTPAYLMGWEEHSNKSKIMMIGGNARYLPVFAESDDIEKALELYKAYSDASPDVKSAIEILLKSHLSDA